MSVGKTVQEIFGGLPDEAVLNDSPGIDTAFTNVHIHLPPNFGSISSVDEAVRHARDERIAVLGSSNYYDHSIYLPFARAAVQAGIVPVFGIEVLTMDETLREQGVLVNDPKNPGKFYLCGKGLTRFDDIDEQARPIWEKIRTGDAQRIKTMIARLNEIPYLQQTGIQLDYSAIARQIAEEKAVPPDTMFLQERPPGSGASTDDFCKRFRRSAGNIFTAALSSRRNSGMR